MSRRSWAIAAVLAVVVVAAASADLWTWHIAALLALVGGWLVAAIVVRRDAQRLGIDGNLWGWVVLMFGWLGLGYWIVTRRRLSSALE